MKGIEIFIDESGDFGPYDPRCPDYIVTMVFHESDDPLFAQIRELEYRLSLLNLEEHCIHTSPAIRGEGEYFVMGDNRAGSIDSRRYEVGTVAADQIKGKVVLRLYPFNQIQRF